MTTYDVGDRVRLRGTFTASDDILTDTTAVCTIRRPDGTLSTPSTTNASTGVYIVDVTLDQEGEWNYRWSGTGNVIAAGEGRFYVRTRRA